MTCDDRDPSVELQAIAVEGSREVVSVHRQTLMRKGRAGPPRRRIASSAVQTVGGESIWAACRIVDVMCNPRIFFPHPALEYSLHFDLTFSRSMNSVAAS
jgi:hypothetical protein